MISGSPILIILYIIGMTGMALTLLELIGIPLTAFYIIIMIVMSFVVTGFWYLYTRHGKAFIITTAILTGVSAIILIPQVYRTTVMIKYMIKWNIPLENMSVDMVLILVLVLMGVFFLFSLEFVMRNHSIMLIAGLALLILVPVFGHTISLINMLMLIVFEAGFIVVNMSEKHSGKNVMTMAKRKSVNILSTVLALVLVLAALIPAFIVEGASEGSLFYMAYETDNFIKDTISRLTGDSLGNGFNDGNVSRGNLFQSSSEQLRLTLDRLPNTTLYLKGYTGRDYSDSNWSSAFNYIRYPSGSISYGELAADGLVNQTINQYTDEIPYSFYYLSTGTSDPVSEMYYMLSPDSTLNDDYFKTVSYGDTTYLQVDPIHESEGYVLNETAYRLDINPLNRSTSERVFIPYYAKDSQLRATSGRTDNSYTNYFLTENNAGASDNLSGESVFRSYLNRYLNVINTAYTSYPANTFARLLQYCRETPLDRLEDITTYILVTLQNKASYSTTPGNTPYNKDVVDYFLFENGQGYCVHFASAAALMYRMYGIPARYATGFVARPTEFRPSEDGSGQFTCTLTGKSAHAWVEIFLNDYGWVPVEVTPTLEGTMHAEYPGYTESTMRASMARHGWTFRGETYTEASDGGLFGIGRNASSNMIAFTTVLIGIAAAGVILFFLIRRRIILKNLSRMSCRRLFDRIIRTLHRSRLMKDYNGSETEFAEVLSSTLECIDIAAAAHLINIMLEVNYSDRKVTKADRDFIEQISRSISKELYSGTHPIKKPVFKFVYVYV